MARPLPWDKWFFEDLDRDCGALSLQARGAWVWIIGDLRNHDGQRTLSLQGWSQVIRASISQTIPVLAEIISAKVCDSSVTADALLTGKCGKSDALVDIKCRRIVRESKERKQHALRQQRYRNQRSDDGRSDAAMTHMLQNGDTGDAEKQEAEITDTPCSPPGGGTALGVDSLFEILWNAFPEHRRKKRFVAFQKFVNLRPNRAMLDRMISAVDKLKTMDEWTKEGGRYVPGIANWLDDRGWESVPIEVHCTTCNRIGVIVRSNGSVYPWSMKREVDEGMPYEVCPECRGKDRVPTQGLPVGIKFPEDAF